MVTMNEGEDEHGMNECSMVGFEVNVSKRIIKILTFFSKRFVPPSQRRLLVYLLTLDDIACSRPCSVMVYSRVPVSLSLSGVRIEEK